MVMQEVLAIGGASTLAVLAVLFWFVWRRVRYPSASWFCAGFAAAALLYAAYALAGTDLLGEGPDPLVAGRIVVSMLFGQALIKLTGLAAHTQRRMSVLLVAYGFVGYLVTAVLRLDRQTHMLMWMPLALAQAVLFAYMARREPRHGHTLVCVALLILPTGHAVAALLGLPATWVRYQAPAPYVLVAMAALMVRMMRERDQLAAALQAQTDAQRQLEAANAGLDQRVRERTQELELLLQHQDGFNRSVAHDLRGPVGSIASYAHLLQEAAERQDMAVLRNGLPRLADTAEQVVRTVNALLRLARASEVKLQHKPALLQPIAAAALDEAVDNLGDPAARHAVHLQPLPAVVGDADVLRQLFVNLLANALKFTRCTPRPRIVVGCEVSAEGVRVFHVRDNGAGFEMGRAQRLFQPFVRLHGKQYDGSGVGLSICQRIVHRHGGEIWAESEPGVGTTFRFTLGQPRPPAGTRLAPWFDDSGDTEVPLVLPPAAAPRAP